MALCSLQRYMDHSPTERRKTERHKTERRMTEHRMTERRKTQQQMTERRMTERRIGHNVERLNIEFECRKNERRKISLLHIMISSMNF
jgi:hypothetical protein